MTQKINLGLRRGLPVIYQTEAAECGLACLAMISGFHGRYADLPELRKHAGMSIKGSRLTDLVRIAERLHMSSRAVRLEMDELSQLATPCILHWDMNHFVVLREVTRTAVVIHDPAMGMRKLDHATFSRHFTGVALELTPTPGFEKQAAAPSMKLSAALGRVVGLGRLMSVVFVLALAIELLGISIPFYLQTVVDNALLSGDQGLLTMLALGFSVIILTQVVIGLMRGWTIMAMAASLKVQGRANLFSHLLRLPTQYFESRHLADIMSRFGSLNEIQSALTQDLIEGVLDGLFTIITLVIMFYISPLLAIVVVIGAALYALMRVALYGPLRAASMEGIIWEARQDSHFLETLRGIRTIKLLNGQGKRRTRWMNLMVETVNRELTAQKLGLAFKTANQLLSGLLTILVIWLGAKMVLEGAFTVGMLLAFAAYKTQFQNRISALTDLLIDLRMLRLHGERLADIVNTDPEPNHEVAPIAVEFAPSVALRDLRFRYSQQDPWVLDGVTLDIEAGESVAIVGPSGCGKTTLLKILASLLDPTEGKMLVGGEPVAHLGLGNYRRAIGVVLQDDQLLAGSITENISFFSASPDRRRVEKCARIAAVHDDISMMPMAYESLIGDMGTSLSGGQKQRLLLARALYRRPRILLLDEATSHLDVDRERHVNDALKRSSMTRIIVAHRPETIRSADRVITMGEGRIVSDRRLREPAQSVIAAESVRRLPNA
ncbi:MAG: peptidase domain-containing ABC transporter [Burkholderiaceae bacterium]